MTIGVIELFGNPFFAEARKGMKAVADKEGVELLIENANSDVGKEAELIQTFVTRQVDVILLSAQSPTGSIAAAKLAKDAGVPVVCWNTCVRPPEDKELVKAFVTSDNKKIGATTGEQAAKYIREKLGGKATVVMLTCQSLNSCKDRREGINKALEGLDVTIADEQEGFQVDKARPIADAMLTAHPEANASSPRTMRHDRRRQAVEAKGLVGQDRPCSASTSSPGRADDRGSNGGVEWTTGQGPLCHGRCRCRIGNQGSEGTGSRRVLSVTAAPPTPRPTRRGPRSTSIPTKSAS